MKTIRPITWLFALTLAAMPLAGCATEDVPSDVETGDSQDITEHGGVFETFQGMDGQYYFHLKAANGEKVLQSEGYVSRSGAQNGIESVKNNGVDLQQYELLEASSGEWYFNLKARNHQIIGTSETYVTFDNAERAANQVRNLVAKTNQIEAALTGGAYFEVFQGLDGQYYFHLVAGNGEIVLQSEGYTSRSGAKGGVDTVRQNGKELDQYEIVEAVDGQHYWRLKAKNHHIIGRSEMYVSYDNAERGAETVSDLLLSEKVANPQ